MNKMLCAYITTEKEDLKINAGAKKYKLKNIICTNEATRVMETGTICNECFIKINEIKE